MLKEYIKIDSGTGYPVDSFLLDPKIDEIAEEYIKPYTESFYRAKWDGEKWIEDMSQEDIDGIQNTPQEPSELNTLKQENEMNSLAIMELAEMFMGGM